MYVKFDKDSLFKMRKIWKRFNLKLQELFTLETGLVTSKGKTVLFSKYLMV